MTTPVRIAGVAIRVGDMFMGRRAPARHHHLLHEMYRLGMEDYGAEAQGFYTSDGRFVTREEAVPIAQAAGQIGEKHGSARILFSEDMW